MMNTKHLPHYASLIGMFVLAVIGFVAFSYDKNFQKAIVVAVALGYVSWGVVHHSLHKDLKLEVFLEYVVFAALGLTACFLLFF